MTLLDQSSTAWPAYEQRVRRLQEQYRGIPAGAPVRLAKRTSNLFRPRAKAAAPGLDVAAFDGVLSVDAERRTADVQGMTTYEHLVDATLPHGLMPLVVPELKTITLGGAVTGLGIESSSWRNGMPHESVLEMDILTGDGEVVTARPDNEHRELFFGFPNSYGTLGYALRLRIELEPVRPFVHLRHLRFASIEELVPALHDACRGKTGEVAFVDGVVFGPRECYLTLGSWAEDAPAVSDYTGNAVYYRSLQARSEDWLTTRDYLWRWDTDWFWCSRVFQVQRRWVRPFVPRRWLRSDHYWKVVRLDERLGAKRFVDRCLGRPEREHVIQDVQVPAERLAEFVRGFQDNVPISPVWLCPLRLRDPDRVWDLYRLDPGQLYVNLGFWSTVPLAPGMDPAHHNRWVEAEVDRLGGRKSLYSTAFYDEDRFWALYGGDAWHRLRHRYDPDNRLLDLYAKCVQSR